MALQKRCTLIRRDTGERIEFPTARAAQKFLGHLDGYLITCTENGIIPRDEEGNLYDYEFGEEVVYETKKREMSLCWLCKNAYYGCSWSRSFEPVPGWNAEYYAPNDSYTVIECPEYIEG